MDLGDKDKFGLEKRGVEILNYHSPNVPLDWRFRDSNLASQPLGLVPSDNSIPISKGDLMVSPMVVDSFCPTLWDHSNAESLSFIDNNVHHASTSTSNTAVIRKGIPVTSRAGIENALDMGWNSPNMMMRGGAFLQNNARNLPPSLSQFPADSGFIERAARFSCFSGGNFGDIVNPFNISESLNPYSKGGVPIQGSQEVLSVNGMNSPLGAESQKNELNMAEISRDRSASIEHGLTGGSPNKNDMEKRSYARPSDEARQGIGMASNESGEAEFSGGGGGQGEQSMVENDGGDPASSKGLGIKKRKRPGQNTEIDQEKGTSQHSGDAAKGDDKTKEKVDQNNTSASNKAAAKHGKDGSQASDAPKEDYIHIRARRGQATNSHSLAERVRREKISERMKFLQELVPGCSKVTGKAVMLDEIINYVQSLQRQVEFLSMKLATVNPRLDFNIEGILGKDILQSRGGPSTLGFSPDMGMVHPHLHPSQQGMISGGIPGLGNSSDALRRTISSQLAALNSGYKDLMPQNHQQIPSGWDDELHNVVQMGFDNNGPFSNQDLNGSLPPGHMKVEL